MRKMKLLASGSAMIVALHGVAMAQTAPATGTRTTTEQPASTEESSGIAEIVVTAQKSSENLQRTAAAVTAVGGEELVKRGVMDIRDAQMVVPAARFQAESNNTQVFVRGVGSNLDFQNIEQTVAFNFNGVYVPREATSAAFFDLASLEVLPGPQGTLYGRGAMGGTLNVQFKRPGFDNEGSALLEGGNFSLIHGSLAQDFALSDQLAIRMAIDYNHHNGYYTSGAEAADDAAGRLSLLFKPSDTFSAYLWAFGAKKNGTSGNAVNHAPKGSANDLHAGGFLTSNPWDDVGAAQFATPIAPFLPFTVGIPKGERNEYEVYSFGGELNLEAGDGLTLTYIPGYTHLDATPYNWIGVLRFNNPAHIEMHSHELRLAGDTGPVKWLTGLFYYHQKNSGTFENSFGGPDNPNPFNQYGPDIRRNILEGEGVFGQATWSATDQLRVTIGGRYSHDRREANGFNPEYRAAGAAPGTGPFTNLADTSWAYRKSYSYVDWKAGVEYDLTPKVMIYATAQTAHAPGTYNAISQAGLADGDPFVNLGNPGPRIPYDGSVEVKEQKLTAFAGGFKSRFFDNTLQLNTEAFYYTYKNLIQQQFNAQLLFNPVFNAAKVEIYGVQADLVWKPTPDDRFSGSVGYTHARSKEFTTPGGDDFSGLQPPYAPDWTLLGSYTHSFELDNGAKVDATVSARYESSWWADYSHSTGTQQEANAKLDASLTYDSGKNWQLGLWGKNLTNKAVLAATAAAGIPGPALGYLEAPRTYGVRFSAKY